MRKMKLIAVASDTTHYIQQEDLEVHEDPHTLVALLKSCAKQNDLDTGCRIHTDVVRMGLLEKVSFVGNAVVSMYAKCNLLTRAQEVCDRLPLRNVVSWNALIAGYAEHGYGDLALSCFDCMQLEGLLPNEVTYICIVKACGSLGAANKGQEIHGEIVKQGLLRKSLVLGNSLVDMYCKWGLFDKAQEVFDELPVRDVVSWNVLITGHVQHGNAEEALDCFEWMQLDGLSPNAITFICILKACGSIGAGRKGQEIHGEIRQSLLAKDVVVGNALVDMFGKCGLLAKAQEVFDELPVRNVVSWNTLIAGYAQNGCEDEALDFFERMELEGLSPDPATFVCILRVCGSTKAIDKGQKLHVEIVRQGLLEKGLLTGNALVDMYAKCGLLAKAQEVFGKLQGHDRVSWNTLIAGYAQLGHGEGALNCFEQMQLEGPSPDTVTFICILKACGNVGAVDKGQVIHAQSVRLGLIEKEIVIGTGLIDMYAKCGALAKAQEVFDMLPKRNIVSWNALIAGYAQHKHAKEALQYFTKMQLEGLSPDVVTFVSILKACGSVGAASQGQEIHAEIAKNDLLKKDTAVGSALVDMYVNCGLLAKAQEVFDMLPFRDVVSWQALIAGYTQHGHGLEALHLFERMQREGVCPDQNIYACIVKACGSIGATCKGQQIHSEIVKEGLPENEIVVGTALIDMYAKCGLLAEAQEVLSKLPFRDVVSWSALIGGYSHHGYSEEALNCFDQIQLEGLSPDAVTYVCALKACGSFGAVHKGQEIHSDVAREGLLEKDNLVGNALVGMYAKCGLLPEAQEAFSELPFRDIVSWSALIAGYALFGKTKQVFHSLCRMVEEGIEPDFVTFTSVLNACTHTGEVEKGQMLFETMSADYRIIPRLEHYTCIVDLFGRAGRLDKAVALIKEMPLSANLTMWHAFLGACQKWGNLKMGKLAFERAVQLDAKDTVAYVCMRNLYTDAGKQKEANWVS